MNTGLCRRFECVQCNTAGTRLEMGLTWVVARAGRICISTVDEKRLNDITGFPCKSTLASTRFRL